MFKFLLLLLINFTLLNCGDVPNKESVKKDSTNKAPDNANNIAKKATKQAINTKINNTVIITTPIKKKVVLQELAAHKKPQISVCDRTLAVKLGIMEQIKNKDCSMITKTDLLTIIRLDLKNKEITSLKKGDFLDLDNLKRLFLSHNKLTTVPEGIFDHLVELELLSIKNNKFKDAYRESLKESLIENRGFFVGRYWAFKYLYL